MCSLLHGAVPTKQSTDSVQTQKTLDAEDLVAAAPEAARTHGDLPQPPELLRAVGAAGDPEVGRGRLTQVDPVLTVRTFSS
jgi:hypothetical protein